MQAYQPTIIDYSPAHKEEWDAFVDRALNTSILYRRDYMDYHSNRFTDASYMVYLYDKLVALLPGHKTETTWSSHLGLTYGGLVVDTRMRYPVMTAIVREVISLSRKRHYRKLIFKNQLECYHRYLDSSWEYTLRAEGFQQTRQEFNPVIDLGIEVPISKTKEGHKRNQQTDFELAPGHLQRYWENVLCPQLESRYNTRPVHSYKEIKQLAAAFPDQIKLWCVHRNERILAGVLIFECGQVARIQYAAQTGDGMRVNAMDYVYLSVIAQYRERGFRFIDMGIVNDGEDHHVNQGLLDYKRSFGAAPHIQRRFELSL